MFSPFYKSIEEKRKYAKTILIIVEDMKEAKCFVSECFDLKPVSCFVVGVG